MVQVDACHYCTGVSQDTRIGPWLFVVMISDLQLLSDKSFHVWKFAEISTSLHRRVQSIWFILAAFGLALVAGMNALNILIPDNL